MNRADARELLSRYVEAPAAKLLVRLGFSPNGITLVGLLIAGASAVLLSAGQLAAGGGVLLFSGIFDLFDGAVARSTGRVTSFGALLDSVVDRVSEAVVLMGLLVFYLDQGPTYGPVLVFGACVGSIMVSYVRARAEGLGIECKKAGIMTRPERVAALGTGLIVGQWWTPAVLIVLGAILALTVVTTIQRMVVVSRAQEEKGVPS